jgi:hypothetical protein
MARFVELERTVKSQTVPPTKMKASMVCRALVLAKLMSPHVAYGM